MLVQSQYIANFPLSWWYTCVAHILSVNINVVCVAHLFAYCFIYGAHVHLIKEYLENFSCMIRCRHPN